MCDRASTPCSSILCALALVVSQEATAQVAPEGTGDLARRTFTSERLTARESLVPLTETETTAAPTVLAPLAPLAFEVRDGWAAFRRSAPGEWRAYVDRRTGRIASAEGAGLPWIPGRGNRLTLAEVGGTVDLSTLERLARGFLGRTARLLGIDPADLVLDRDRSGQVADYLWLVDFQLVRGGRTVFGARVTFTVNNGNLIQFGTVQLPDFVPAMPAIPAIETVREAALAVLSVQVGGFTAADRFVDAGSLHLLPADLADGHGRGLLAVWDFRFRRAGVVGTWRGRVDATTGELLAFGDSNDYAHVTGGIYPSSYAADAEILRPLPFAALSSGAVTDSAGFFDSPGAPVSSQLTGPYVAIHDQCGAVQKGSDGLGDILFGLSSGTDCATPGFGGPGNTHAARLQFYQVNRALEMGRGWLPQNAWLSGTIPVNVNLNQFCNAYWNGFSLNFFHAGTGSCGNTGEIASISLHELGHGLDENDGGGESPDGASRESYADVTAALVTHDSCGGPGLFRHNCGGYGDPCTACSGARDIDWARHTSGAPHTAATYIRNRCSSGGANRGPCGREAHCESYVPSEAVWDLATRDLPGVGEEGNEAWAVAERLWYRSRAAAGSAFTCNTSSAPWTTDGCQAGSLWRVLRAADDDDGNLANGTPHSCALYAALARHGLACPGDPAAATCFAACLPPAATTLTLTPGHRRMRLDWADVATGGSRVVYDVFRNESSCNAGFTRIATVRLGTTYVDNAVADGLPYNYQVIARPSGNEACSGAPGVCRSAVPGACTAVPLFSGLASASRGTGELCSARLSWTPATSLCGGPVTYSVYRETTAGFLPSPQNRIATGLPGTFFADPGPLKDGTVYVYIVRAAEGSNGAEEGNRSEKSVACVSPPPPPPALRFYTLPPCRAIDTRSPAGLLGGPALPPNAQRNFALTGACGLPATAQAVAMQVTVVNPAGPGDLRLFAAAAGAPMASAINFGAGQTRTNNAIVGLSPGGWIGARNDAGTEVDLVVEVMGYFK